MQDLTGFCSLYGVVQLVVCATFTFKTNSPSVVLFVSSSASVVLFVSSSLQLGASKISIIYTLHPLWSSMKCS